MRKIIKNNKENNTENILEIFLKTQELVYKVKLINFWGD